MTTTTTASNYTRDLVERVVWTFAQAFGATLVASGWFTVEGVVDLAIAEKAGIAGVAAVLSLLKGIVAKGVGDKESAQLAP